jgi:hypothetical protein
VDFYSPYGCPAHLQKTQWKSHPHNLHMFRITPRGRLMRHPDQFASKKSLP